MIRSRIEKHTKLNNFIIRKIILFIKIDNIKLKFSCTLYITISNSFSYCQLFNYYLTIVISYNDNLLIIIMLRYYIF